MQRDNIPRDGGIQENNNERSSCYNLNQLRKYIITSIIVIFAIIMYQYFQGTGLEIEFPDYDDIFKLPTNDVINQNIVNCSILSLRVEQSVAFINTGPQLVVKLNEFRSILINTKSSYIKMYIDGTLFILNFEQLINDTLNYISSNSFMATINRKTYDNLQNSLEESKEALNNFYSSVEKAYDATSIAESFRNGTHKQVIEAIDEVQRFIENIKNRSHMKRIRDFIDSVIDTTKLNDLKVDSKTATEIESFLLYLNNDLENIEKILLKVKEDLLIHEDFLDKLKADIGTKWNERKINKVRNLLDIIKKNHKNFKSRVNQ